MFRKHHEEKRRRGLGIYGLFRLLLSLAVLGILGVGVIAAGKSFTGVDPLKLDPASILKQVVSSQSAVNLLERLLTVDPTSPLSKFLPGFLKNTGSPVIPISSTIPSSDSAGKAQNLAFKFAMMADSENDNQDLSKAINQAKASGVSFILDLGDLSQVGTVDELTAAKHLFDQSDLPYYVIPGDHDMWDSRNRGFPPDADFNVVYGSNYQSIVYKEVGFVMVDNSDNYNGISQAQQNWITDQLSQMQVKHLKLVFIVSGTPFYHPSSDHVMGKDNPDLKPQAAEMISLFKKYQVSEVMSGDAHLYSEYTEPKSGLKMMTVGAVTADRNLESPRYAIIDVYQNGSYNIEDTEIK